MRKYEKFMSDLLDVICLLTLLAKVSNRQLDMNAELRGEIEVRDINLTAISILGRILVMR